MTDNIAPLREITSAAAWRGVVESFLAGSAHLPSSPEDFGTYWIEGGHRIREQVADDRLLVKFLRAVLPPYAGGSITLFRGENQDRFSAGLVGFSWTPDSKVASMFAKGLNAVGSGGVLISTTLDSPAIISGPNAHSVYLGEQQFTVDPFAATGIRSVAVFPAMQLNNSFKPKPLLGSA
jgi:hypothetical protein